MEIVAYQKYVRTSPRKIQLIADAVRQMHPTQALTNLEFMHKRAADVLKRVLNQAVKNAVNNSGLNEKDLKIKHILVEKGPQYKRFNAASRGRARTILKKTSHIKVVLEGKEVKKVQEEPKTDKKTKENSKLKK
ncbi:50S ribosomal protein L22 [Candidatus Beckwithbacteria bacterium]|nr:50S ribosomal protein L22 [Candidatus Beckwithbacteria bacterium]